jgi:hypothetical protein
LAFEARHHAKGLLGNRHQSSAAGAVDGEIWKRCGGTILHGPVRQLVRTGNVEILIEAIGAGGVDQFFVQFLIENAFYSATFSVQNHPVVPILNRALHGSRRSWRRLWGGLHGIRFVTERGQVLGHETDMMIVRPGREDLVRNGLVRCQVHEFEPFVQVNFYQAGTLPTERVEDQQGTWRIGDGVRQSCQAAPE